LNGFKLVTGYYCNTKGIIYSLTTVSGKGISGTKDHKVLVKNNDTEFKWIKLSELKVGEKILIKNGFE